MEKIELNSDHKKLIKSYMARFKKYTEGVQFAKDQEERTKRINYFQIELRKKIPDLSESEIEELVVKL
jgi:hypothetical protein